ncbi:BLUF domain-containing protein [Hymenobacter properus]|uniref:BLUF domain-containing protein n=1 Tax=Hymenobacter properus TaxID=2791026 RepID=A0A931BM20_9BACT|nr:BLUF domain-containing protein [Hymenobacter properus]MBF9143887.1 BLUF domain-containing protein [Hymenobacter properus]MBR7722701.1 BLUF domain-containing protein [Microvirga sp. SRT04]
MGLYQLLYQSEALMAFDTPELLALLHQCRTRNATHNMTGLLLYAADGRFLQLLEGEQAAVHDLYHQRIARDPRHFNCRVLREGPCEARTFGAWAMSFRPASGHDLRDLPGYVSPDDPSRLVPQPHTQLELIALLLDFLIEHEPVPWLNKP